MRPDYCPMWNEPCQSMCDVPCSAHRLQLKQPSMNTIGNGSNGYPISTRVLTNEFYNALLADRQVAAHAKRLALELECLLLSCDTATATNWWTSAHEALANYQADIDRLYPQPHVSPLGKE